MQPSLATQQSRWPARSQPAPRTHRRASFCSAASSKRDAHGIGGSDCVAAGGDGGGGGDSSRQHVALQLPAAQQVQRDVSDAANSKSMSRRQLGAAALAASTAAAVGAAPVPPAAAAAAAEGATQAGAGRAGALREFKVGGTVNSIG